MVSIRSGVIRDTLFEDSHPHLTTMIDIDTLQQLQNRIAKMERCHKKELRKLKADHDQLEARIRCPQGEYHSTHTFLEHTQGESHPQRTINTLDDLSLSHMHRPTGQPTRWHPFIDHIMEEGIP